MRKHTISIIAKNYWSSDFLKIQMEEVFGDLFQFTTHSPDTTPILPIFNADMILLHEPSVLENMYQYIKCDCPSLLLRRTITASALEELRKIPEGSKAVVVNLNDYMARETLINIYQLGIKKIMMTTWTPDQGSFPDNHLDYIITPRLYDFIPKNNIKKIKLGSRILEVDIIMDILSYFNIDLLKSEEIIMQHMNTAPNFFHGVNYILENNRYLSVQLDSVFDTINKSIAIVDNRNTITYVNQGFAQYLNVNKTALINNTLDELVWMYPSLQYIKNEENISDELIDINDKKIILNTNKLWNRDKYLGKVVKLESYDHIQHVQQKSHEKLIGHHHTAKYSFNDLIGKDKLFHKRITLGKKVAPSDHPILIYGESGTGKELMASAIHNYSNRCNNPYVAVNCGSIPYELFESEFFGYEEGAFTGSKKGGRMGLFEKADGGTIFLDEISEIPYDLQSRLLRVLQEKEIRKVGSNKNIHINVRVIAASNKDLYELAKINKFRMDLFFRINVFQITMPSLRKRKTDIEILCNHFAKDKNKKTSKEFISFIQNYHFPGNIRELKNLIEFASITAEKDIDIRCLPDYIKTSDNIKPIIINPEISLMEALILKIIAKNMKNSCSTSRRSICENFSNSYFEISEVKTRKILNKIEEKGYITIPKGRSGCSITEKAEDYLNE